IRDFHVTGVQTCALPIWNTKLQYFLSSYMLPTEYYLLDQFPLTTSGKIDRQTLAQLEALPYTGISFMPRAETPEEKIIAEIWGRSEERRVGIRSITRCSA